MIFPEGTVICLRGKGVMSALLNKKKNDAEYAESEAMFRAIIQYQGTSASAVAE